MKSTTDSRGRAAVLTAAVCATVLATLLLAPAEAGAKPPPPAKRVYFVIFLGFEADFDLAAECFKFTKTRWKTLVEPGISGGWQYREQAEERHGITVDSTIFLEMGGITVQAVLDGEGRIDDRGQRSAMSFSGLLQVPVAGLESNFAAAARETKGKRQCLSLAQAFYDALGE